MRKIMMFADGPKEIYVGMEVVHPNGQGGRNFTLHKSTVKKIGNKYATLADGSMFYLNNGTRKSEYTWGYLFSSLESYKVQVERDRTINKVEKELRSIRLTYAQALNFAAALGLDLTQDELTVKESV